MKLLTTLILVVISTLALNAQTTMCYKENHTNIATINSTPLDGGLCHGTQTIKDMEEAGWTTEDIKINHNTFTYIFKKITTVDDVNMEELEKRVLQRINDEKTEKKKLEKEKLSKSKIANGRKLYVENCILCHGKFGDTKAYGTRPINSLNLKSFKLAVIEYINDDRDKSKFDDSVNPYAKLMKPYASILTPTKINNIYVYLKSINKNTSQIKEKK